MYLCVDNIRVGLCIIVSVHILSTLIFTLSQTAMILQQEHDLVLFSGNKDQKTAGSRGGNLYSPWIHKASNQPVAGKKTLPPVQQYDNHYAGSSRVELRVKKPDTHSKAKPQKEKPLSKPNPSPSQKATKFSKLRHNKKSDAESKKVDAKHKGDKKMSFGAKKTAASQSDVTTPFNWPLKSSFKW